MTTLENIEMGKTANGVVNINGAIVKCKGWFGVRHVQVFLAFYLMFIAYGLRVNLSVGIVAMTDPTASPNKDIPTFPNWTDKSVILSSFFWGYLPPQAFAGQLAKKYGPKWFLISAMLICCLFTYLLPITAIQYGSYGVMFCRIMQGVGQGFVYPMIHDILSKWVPACERSRLGTYVYAGGACGTVVSMLVTGFLSASWWGWPSVFYLYGTLSLIWILLMVKFGCNNPDVHKKIKEEERLYISNGSARSDGEECPTPWKEIFTSAPVWSLIIVHCGQNWGFWTLMTELPSYISGVMKFNIKSNSLLSALPYFTLWVLSFIFSAFADYLINRKITSIGVTRKLLNSIGLFIPAAALIALGFMTVEQKKLAVFLLVTAVGTNAAIYSGFNINHIDIAPNHSGVLMGITNGASNICALIAPLFVHVIVTDHSDVMQWRTVFIFTAALYVITNCVFLIFGTGKLQDWNEPKQKRNGSVKLPPNGTIESPVKNC
ncbi:putative inorganic phosphate cotransporter isoform X1 [Harmonia axyridis]|uniref:putative inorganic phosphate cotransporter isoform X1 n=2 Tax=Harmonia axyridis TaxID=115357 RepID=UPI001E278C44|nr:putative inorganic phosphate cotransporter isoform X1 [Harmonia axyridis]XP_045477154.1 putative inorganic phosphate cotransporter isoform X1 [Harmonia axyridis]